MQHENTAFKFSEYQLLYSSHILLSSDFKFKLSLLDCDAVIVAFRSGKSEYPIVGISGVWTFPYRFYYYGVL